MSSKLALITREGEGTQTWGWFCSLTGKWVRDEIESDAKITFPYFPVEISLMLEKKRINSAKFALDLMKLDIMYDHNFQI